MGDDNIIHLSGSSASEKQADIIEVAERILELAKAGHLRTLVWSSTTAAGAIKCGWSFGDDAQWPEALGAAAALVQELSPPTEPGLD